MGLMEVAASSTAPRLPWKWIAEKVVHLADFGAANVNEMVTTYVTDIEEPHSRPLLERVALRNLEEMVVVNQIDSDAIPLLKALTGQDLGPLTMGSSVKQRFNKELVLRVQTEIVLSVLRKDADEKEKDWACYEVELQRVFGEAEVDNCLLARKRELGALLKPKNQSTAIVAAYFEKYPFIKLKNDLLLFIDEKRESFTTMFLDQLSRDFLDANGTLFSEEPVDVEKCMKVEANAKQDHEGTANVQILQSFAGTHINEDMNLQAVGQNLKLNETASLYDMNRTGDYHIVVGTQTASDKKRLKRKLLSTRGDIADDEPEEVQEDSAGSKKSRKASPNSVVYPLKALLHQGDSTRAIPRFGSQSGCFPVEHGFESVMQNSSLRRGEEAVSAPRNISSKVIRNCSPPVHGSKDMERADVPLRERTRANKYVIISDVESDSETQVVRRLSSDAEDDPIENCEDVDHQKTADQYLSENGSDQGYSEKIVATEVVKSERKVKVDRKIEASTASPAAKSSQLGETQKFVTENGSMPQDTQDIYEVHFREVGSDGHEDVCHTCGLHGELLCCDGCPISMHFECIEGLGLKLPKREEHWYCPICMSLKAALKAAEAEKAAAAAEEKLKSFQEYIKSRSSFQGNLLHHPKQEKAVKQSSLRVTSLLPEVLDMASKPQQQSEEEPKLRYTERQQDIEPPEASHQLTKNGEEDPENTSGDSMLKNQSKRVVSFGQGEDRKMLIDVGRALCVNERKPLTRFSKKEGPDFDSGEESAEHVAGSLAPGSSAVGDGGDDEDSDKDGAVKSEYLYRSPFCSGRSKLTGLRRKRLPWTREEEHALKEGVKRFSHNGSWGFQWKRILEFGQGRFDPSRTDVDLKDKWRNLVKGVS